MYAESHIDVPVAANLKSGVNGQRAKRIDMSEIDIIVPNWVVDVLVAANIYGPKEIAYINKRVVAMRREAQVETLNDAVNSIVLSIYKYIQISRAITRRILWEKQAGSREQHTSEKSQPCSGTLDGKTPSDI